MPQNTAIATFSRLKLTPLYPSVDMLETHVALKANTTYQVGTVLGEVTATPGTYGPYASGNSDGTQNPAGFLAYGCTTDASGNITNYGEFGVTHTSAPMILPMAVSFRTQDLVGLDANAQSKLSGVLTEGTLTAGTIVF